MDKLDLCLDNGPFSLSFSLPLANVVVLRRRPRRRRRQLLFAAAATATAANQALIESKLAIDELAIDADKDK